MLNSSRQLFGYTKDDLAVETLTLDIIPIFRETKHQGQQALCLEGDGLIPQVVIAHHGVILGAFHTKNCHNISLQLHKN